MIDKREPWSKFYWADWRANKELRLCSLAARGLWMEMLCLMHEATPYGHLLINGKAPTLPQIAVQVGAPTGLVRKALDELEGAGVATIKDGVWISRRMVRDAHRRAVNQANGASGGNPRLLDKGSDNPPPPKPDNPTDKSRDARDREARSQRPDTRPRDFKTSELDSRSRRSAAPRARRITDLVGIDWARIVQRMQSHGFEVNQAWQIAAQVGERQEFAERMQGAMRSAERRGTSAFADLVAIASEVPKAA